MNWASLDGPRKDKRGILYLGMIGGQVVRRFRDWNAADRWKEATNRKKRMLYDEDYRLRQIPDRDKTNQQMRRAIKVRTLMQQDAGGH